ncbi:MAG: DUF2155 domain-containing protein [Cereibacter changlensis]|jgi:hypothetical protein|uniref:DUF2155 domain-containing protein n=2 Tax=Cereibacter changlensis TaxID=402884 RepID=A0A2T4JU52_9RHOB|nr:DUF2155 domain-containing protein [Cereibacter changlensis]PTE21451.1 DUF2155 domain-containing protein [Cereibacter changlensis JA139]PZX57121.1 uncharacterized protein DUF2155 [Cereibacter changlensis]TKA94840.1 DUF2155 domain-containing protein [Cereibacter changlensis]
MRGLACLLALLAAPAFAQDVPVSEAQGGLLRWLDKISGETADVELQLGQSAVSNYLTIQLDACRYPTNDPASDAYAHLTIRDTRVEAPVFSGWMIASSPALSALDHPRYDVWVLRCITPETSGQ